MQKCYTLYLGARNTEHHTFTAKDYEEIEEALKLTSSKYTIILGNGYWKGASEDTAIIVLALDNDDRHESRIQTVCSALQKKFGQDAVMCQLSGDAVLLKEGNVGVKNVITNMAENSARTDWAKAMLERLPEQGIVKPLKRKSAISKLVKLKKENPQADFPEAQKLLKEKFQSYADDLG